MLSIIADVLKTRKAHDVALVLLIGLASICSFGLGRLSVETPTVSPVVLSRPGVQGATSIGGTNSATTGVQYVAAVASSERVLRDAVTAPPGALVASKNGEVYHSPWCPGARRIREDNKVWFASKAEAEAAGYRPASTCTGL